MKLKGIIAIVGVFSLGMLSGCGGGRSLTSSSSLNSSVAPLAQSVNDSGTDIKFAKKPKKPRKKKKNKLPPPVISNLSVTPTVISSEGGDVIVKARVVSNSSTLGVTADATAPGFAPIPVALISKEGGFEGRLSINVKNESTTTDRVFQVNVRANDNQNPVVPAFAGTVTQLHRLPTTPPPTDGPPPPPQFP